MVIRKGAAGCREECWDFVGRIEERRITYGGGGFGGECVRSVL